MRLRLQNTVEASVHIINQASVPQGLSSNLTEASEKQKRISKLQLVTDEAEIKKKDYTMNQVKILISTKKNMRLLLETILWRHQSILLIRRQFPKICHHI